MDITDDLVYRYAEVLARIEGHDDPAAVDFKIVRGLLEQLAADRLLIPADGMPRFTLLAKDNVAPRTLAYYSTQCRAAGWDEQADQVQLAIDEFEQWRAENPDRCKMPDHVHVPTIPWKPARRPVDDGPVSG